MKPVLVTTSWDDGHKLDLKLAELLKKYGIKGTFYVSPHDREFLTEQMLTTAQLRHLDQDFEIGAHTMTHPHLSECDAETARQEIIESKLRLEQIVGHEVTSFCYPYGDYTQQTKEIVREAGFTYARSVQRFATRSIDRFAAKTSVDTFDHMRAGVGTIIKMCGRRPWRALKLWRWDNLAKELFAQARDRGEVFHLWGHSHEIEAHGDWGRLEKLLKWLSQQENVQFIENSQVPIERPKLLITTPYFKPHTGGLEEYAFQTAKGLQTQHDWDVVVATSDECKELVTEDYQGVKVYRLPITRKISNTPIGIHWRKTLNQIIATERPDLIDAHAPVPGMLDITSRVVHKLPLVVTYHMGSMRKNGTSSAVNAAIWIYEHLLLRRPLHKARAIICSSPYVQLTYLARYFYKSVAITPGVDTTLCRPNAGKRRTHHMLHVGGLKPGEDHKGLEVSLRAVAKLKRAYPDMRLIVVGEGAEQPRYEALAAELGIAKRVDFVGRYTGKNMATAYQSVDLFINPSSKESFGMAIVEAMASGLPVIAGDAEGVPYVVRDGVNGLLIDPQDHQALAKKIDWVYKHPADAGAIGKAARLLVTERYQWNIKVSQTDKYLRLALHIQEEPPKPKLLIATPYYWPKVGGLENYAGRIATQMQQHGWEVVAVASNHDGDGFEVDDVDGVRVYRLPTTLRISNTPIGVRWPFYMRRIVRHERPDIINAHTPVPGVADAVAVAAGKTPLMLTYHAATLYKHNNLPFNIVIAFYRYFEQRMLTKATKIITVTPYHKDYMNKQVRSKFYLIENAIPDTELLAKMPIKKPQHVAFINNLVKAHAWKGLEETLHAVAIYKKREKQPIHLDVIGGGDYLSHYKKVVKDLDIGAHVTFHGEKVGQAKNDILQEASAFICYPTSAQDAFPTVMLEAWAHYTPVIAANIGAIPHIVSAGEDGLLAVPNNPDALAIVMATLLQNKKLQKTLAINGHARAAKQTWSIQGAKTDALFREYIR